MTVVSTAELRETALVAGPELELAPAEAIIEWAVDTFGSRFCITSSMGDAVLSHLASKVAPGIDVVFLDTGYHFVETIGTRDAVAATMPVNLLTITPVQSVAEQDAEHGAKLHDRDPDLCCSLRKVQPLARTLAGFTAWGSGIRRDESPTRADTRLVDWDAKRGMVKVNPIAAWTQDDVDSYLERHQVPVNPLVELGYGSIGCAPCTRPVAPGEDPRAGRWAGSTKTECGLHT